MGAVLSGDASRAYATLGLSPYLNPVDASTLEQVRRTTNNFESFLLVYVNLTASRF